MLIGEVPNDVLRFQLLPDGSTASAFFKTVCAGSSPLLRGALSTGLFEEEQNDPAGPAGGAVAHRSLARC